MTDLISSTLIVEGPITAIKLAMWVQGYLVITGIGAIIKWMRTMWNA
jgi:hypothetical protein